MPYFTPQPLIVEARQFKDTDYCKEQMLKWRVDAEVDNGILYVLTEDDGWREVIKSDWVIKYTELDGTELWSVWCDDEFRDQWCIVQ